MEKNDWVSIGVDPGKEGFITVLRADKIEHFSIPKLGKEIDVNGLATMISDIMRSLTYNRIIVVIEDVHAIHGASAVSTFNFGLVCGFLRMAFAMEKVPFVLVAPKKWQKEMYEGIRVCADKKVMSIAAAKRLFPQLDLKRTPACKKPDDNLTDSLLIAEYGRRKFL